MCHHLQAVHILRKRNCGILRLAQMRLCIHDLSGKWRVMDACEDAERVSVVPCLHEHLQLMGWRVCVGIYSAPGLINCREMSNVFFYTWGGFFKPLSVFLCWGRMRSPTDVSHWHHHVGLYFGVFVDFRAEARSPHMKGRVYRETIL